MHDTEWLQCSVLRLAMTLLVSISLVGLIDLVETTSACRFFYRKLPPRPASQAKAWSRRKLLCFKREEVTCLISLCRRKRSSLLKKSSVSSSAKRDAWRPKY